jgi:serine phosphatase RsbU (regulator of sigma subunit)
MPSCERAISRMTFLCLSVTLAVQFLSRDTREQPFRDLQETFGSVASYLRDRAGARGHRVRGLCPFGLDKPADVLVGHDDGDPHGRQPCRSARLLEPPVVRKATASVELGRLFPRPNRIRRHLRCSLDILPASDQNRSRAILPSLLQNRLFLHRGRGDRQRRRVRYRGIQRSLKQRNQLLEQTVEKGTIALQQQEEELKRAREIQQMLLPSKLPQPAGAQIAGAWQPAREVGGDYFDVIQLDEKRIGICVGDVAGKGITAALLMANLQASFRALATADASPQVVCTKLNKFLCANTAPGKFVTFFYAVLDAEGPTLTYENAGHSPGLLLRSNGTTESLQGGGAVLGALPDWTYQDYVTRLQPGDKLLLSTDGITEAENAQLEEFGEERLIEVARARDGSALDIQRAIMQQVTTFCNGNFRDDATLLVLRIS